MTTNTCTTVVSDGETCVICTGQEFIPAVPPHVILTPLMGWNAGANSAARLTGDLHATFQPTVNTEDVIGFAPLPRADVINPNNILYGWHLVTVAGTIFAQPIVSGVLVSSVSPQAVTTSSVLELKRVRGMVTALIDDTLVYQFETLSAGYLLLGCALFLSGDTI